MITEYMFLVGAFLLAFYSLAVMFAAAGVLVCSLIMKFLLRRG